MGRPSNQESVVQHRAGNISCFARKASPEFQDMETCGVIQSVGGCRLPFNIRRDPRHPRTTRLDGILLPFNCARGSKLDRAVLVCRINHGQGEGDDPIRIKDISTRQDKTGGPDGVSILFDQWRHILQQLRSVVDHGVSKFHQVLGRKGPGIDSRPSNVSSQPLPIM